jgi:hypothetical protein
MSNEELRIRLETLQVLPPMLPPAARVVVTCGAGWLRSAALYFTKGKAVAGGQRQAPHGRHVMVPPSLIHTCLYMQCGPGSA